MAAFRSPVCFMNFWADSLPTSLLYISILLGELSRLQQDREESTGEGLVRSGREDFVEQSFFTLSESMDKMKMRWSKDAHAKQIRLHQLAHITEQHQFLRKVHCTCTQLLIPFARLCKKHVNHRST